jgi:hypothetical protein
MAKDGTPITWPLAARYYSEQNHFLLTTSIGLPQKAFNIRRNSHVSLLFSDPTGSGLNNPPAVLVQGDAIASDKVITAVDGFEDYWRETIFRRQPNSEVISKFGIMRKLMDWYYMRIMLYVTPKKVTWWQQGDFSQSPQTVEVNNVA